MFSFFTTTEANSALPGVIKKFEHALAKKNEVSKLGIRSILKKPISVQSLLSQIDQEITF